MVSRRRRMEEGVRGRAKITVVRPERRMGEKERQRLLLSLALSRPPPIGTALPHRSLKPPLPKTNRAAARSN